MSDTGEPTGNDTIELAQAIDVALDAADAAVEAGDVATAQGLLTAAEETSDALLEALGVPEADDGSD